MNHMTKDSTEGTRIRSAMDSGELGTILGFSYRRLFYQLYRSTILSNQEDKVIFDYGYSDLIHALKERIGND